MTPPKRTVSSSTSIMARRSRSLGLRRDEAADLAPELGQVLRHLLDDAARCGQQHLQHADAEQDREQLGGHAPVVEQGGQEPQEQRRHHGAPQVVDAAHQHDGQQRDRVLHRELVDVDAAAGRRPAAPPAMPAMNEASANAHSLYSVVLTPAATAVAWLWRMAAHARPALLRTCQSATRNIRRGHDHAVAVVGGVAVGQRRPGQRATSHRRPRSCRRSRRRRSGTGRCAAGR